jgi:hypothetical protein
MQIDKIIQTAREGNADQTFAMVDEARSTEPDLYESTSAGYELDILLEDYTSGELDDPAFCINVIIILEFYKSMIESLTK